MIPQALPRNVAVLLYHVVCAINYRRLVINKGVEMKVLIKSSPPFNFKVPLKVSVHKIILSQKSDMLYLNRIPYLLLKILRLLFIFNDCKYG